MEKLAFEKSKAIIIKDNLEYFANSVVIKCVVKEPTCTISAFSFDAGEVIAEKMSAFDTFIQVIEGQAEIFIDNHPHLLQTGESIIIPAHTRNMIKAHIRFKMISTIIKSGYEEVTEE